MIGETPIFDTSDGDDGFFDKIENGIQSTVNEGVGDMAGLISEKAGIHDFYSVHLMTYCEGFFEPNGTAVQPDGSAPSENVTGCSNRTTMFHFNPKKALQSELNEDWSLGDLKWPDDINDGIMVLESASKAMFVFYVAGIGVTGLALIMTLFTIFANGRMAMIFGFALSGVRTTPLLFASLARRELN